MRKPTPRDLFNPPPQAGEWRDGSRNAPTHYHYSLNLRQCFAVRDGVIIPVGEPVPGFKGLVSNGLPMPDFASGVIANTQPYVVKESLAGLYANTLACAATREDERSKGVFQVPPEMHADLNRALNVAAGGYRLKLKCQACSDTGWKPTFHGPLDACEEVGCLAGEQRRATGGPIVDSEGYVRG